jgi:heptosyltransferase-2
MYAVEREYLPYILNEQFDIGICLDADPRSATILSLARCHEKIGYIATERGVVVPATPRAEPWYHIGTNDTLKAGNRTTYQRHIYDICRLSTEIAKPQLTLCAEGIRRGKEFVAKYGLGRYSIKVGINTGGGGRWQHKKWIPEYYVELIHGIARKHGTKVGILLFGGPEEVALNEWIHRKAEALVYNTGCDNSVMEFAGLVNITDAFVTSDSLGMHVSVALNKHTIVLVGPTSPWELDVYGKGHVLYNEELPCIACYRSTCDLEVNCMNTLRPEYILEKLTEYIDARYPLPTVQSTPAD